MPLVLRYSDHVVTVSHAEYEAMRQAWLNGDWSTLQSHDDPAIAAIAARQIDPADELRAETAPVLARNSAMIEDSQSVRSEIEALLSEITVPPANP